VRFLYRYVFGPTLYKRTSCPAFHLLNRGAEDARKMVCWFSSAYMFWGLGILHRCKRSTFSDILVT